MSHVTSDDEFPNQVSCEGVDCSNCIFNRNSDPDLSDVIVRAVVHVPSRQTPEINACSLAACCVASSSSSSLCVALLCASVSQTSLTCSILFPIVQLTFQCGLHECPATRPVSSPRVAHNERYARHEARPMRQTRPDERQMTKRTLGQVQS